jgi:predicted nucleic acid-binding protein
MPKTEVFLDTAYAIALSSSRDEHYQKALFLADRLEADGTILITTRAIILEIGNALSKQGYRQAAVILMESLEEDPNVEIVPLTEELYKEAFDMYAKRMDKEWGITDCISFIVMSERGIQKALTTDRHFTQAGFEALLREGPEGV